MHHVRYKPKQKVSGNEPYGPEDCAPTGWKGYSHPESVIWLKKSVKHCPGLNNQRLPEQNEALNLKDSCELEPTLPVNDYT